MKIPALIEMTWIDAHFDNAASTEKPEYVPVKRHSIGYDLGEQNGAMGIAQTVDFAGEGDAIMFQDMLWIPRQTVIGRKVVRRAIL